MTITTKNFQREQPPLKLSRTPVTLLSSSLGQVKVFHLPDDFPMYIGSPRGGRSEVFFTYLAAKAYMVNHAQ